MGQVAHSVGIGRRASQRWPRQGAAAKSNRATLIRIGLVQIGIWSFRMASGRSFSVTGRLRNRSVWQGICRRERMASH